MFLIVGYVIILAASIGTYAVHGSLAALWVPLEYLAIFGLTVGGFIAGNDVCKSPEPNPRCCAMIASTTTATSR